MSKPDQHDLHLAIGAIALGLFVLLSTVGVCTGAIVAILWAASKFFN